MWNRSHKIKHYDDNYQNNINISLYPTRHRKYTSSRYDDKLKLPVIDAPFRGYFVGR
jgi:hypothetical protein